MFENPFQKLQCIVLFVQTRQNLTHVLLIIFWENAKIMHFINFLKNMLQIFENFLKISHAKIMQFSQFLKKFFFPFLQVFSKFPRNCVCSPNVQKGNAWFVKPFEKYAKIIHFAQCSSEILWTFSKIFNKFHAKIRHFSQFSYEIFLLNFRKVPPPSRKWTRRGLGGVPGPQRDINPIGCRQGSSLESRNVETISYMPPAANSLGSIGKQIWYRYNRRRNLKNPPKVKSLMMNMSKIF